MEQGEEVKEKVSSDGIVRSLVLLVGKRGDSYQIASFLTTEEFRDKAIETFKESSGVFVFPVEVEGQYNDIVIPAREVYSLTIKKFSQITQIKPPDISDLNGQRQHRR